MSNNEIRISLPLSAIQGADSMSPAALVEFLSNAVDIRADRDQVVMEYNQLVDSTNSAGRNLERILDEVSNDWDRVRALRQFAAEMKTMQRMKR